MSNRWFIICIAIVLLLAVRGIYLMINRGDADSEWFIQNLDYDFGARIDSARTRSKQVSIIFFHQANGKFDPKAEKRLDRELKHRHVNFITRWGTEYVLTVKLVGIKGGDSLVVNTNKNAVLIFRDGKEILKTEPVTYGKPFR